MNSNLARRFVLACCAIPLLIACGDDGIASTTVIADISQPRGLSVGDSSLCVAEAGAIGPTGPVREQPGQLEADTGRVVCAPTDGGEPVVVLDGLPFVYYPEAAVTSGAADVIRDGEHTWVLIGESYGPMARSVVAVDPSGPRQVVDLLAFAEASNGARSGTRSNPYSFVPTPDGAGFFISDAATGTVLRAGLDGRVETFAVVPGHEVLTGIAWGPDRDLYVASFGQLPHRAGTGSVVALDQTGAHRVVVDGLTMAIDVGFDRSGGLLILEYADPPDEPQGVDAYRDRSGRLSYLPSSAVDSDPVVLLDRLDRPTALAVVGNDVLISVAAGEQAAGEGSVVRFGLDELLEQ